MVNSTDKSYMMKIMLENHKSIAQELNNIFPNIGKYHYLFVSLTSSLFKIFKAGNI